MDEMAMKETISWLYLPGPMSMRVSWMVENIILPHPEIHEKYASDLAQALLNSPSEAMRRNIAKTLAESHLPQEWYDELYDFAIKRILSSEEAVAVKVHCLKIAFQIAVKYPDLLVEVREVIEEQRTKNSVGFAACSKKYAKKIEKLMA